MTSRSKTKRSVSHKNGNGKAVSRRETTVAVFRPLTASSLKDVLWETLNDVKTEQMMPNRADAIAAQSREILRTIKTQLQIAGQSKRQVTPELIEFAERR